MGIVAFVASFVFGITTIQQCIPLSSTVSEMSLDSSIPDKVASETFSPFIPKDYTERCNNEVLQMAISRIRKESKIRKYSIERNDCLSGKFPRVGTVVFVLLQDQDTEIYGYEWHSVSVMMVIDNENHEIASAMVRDIGKYEGDSITDLRLIDFDANGTDEIYYVEHFGDRGPNVTRVNINTIEHGKLKPLLSIITEAFDSMYTEGESKFYSYTADVELFQNQTKTVIVLVKNTKFAKEKAADLLEDIILTDKPIFYQLESDGFNKIQQ